MTDSTKNAANQDAKQAIFAAQEAPDSAQVALTTDVLTAAMKQQLRERGYSDNQINDKKDRFTPQLANAVIAALPPMSAPDTRPVDWSAAKRFLDWIDPSADALWCFLILDDHKIKAIPKRAALTKVLHANRANLPTVLEQLEWLNARGAGIFVTVNRSDGRARRGENITAIRALFIDLDHGGPEHMLASERPPHRVVATSPGKFHCYWRVLGMPLEDFVGAEEALLERFGGDVGVKSIEHVLRVPGFWHRKGEPFLARVVHGDERPPYQANEFPKKPQPQSRRLHIATDEDALVHPTLVAATVAFIPNPDLHWVEWNRRGMAIFRCTGGSEEGCKIFDDYSRKSLRKYNARETRARWQHYFRSPPDRIGYGTLHWLATQAVPNWREQLDAQLLTEYQRAEHEYNTQVHPWAVKMLMPLLPPSADRQRCEQVGIAIHRCTAGSDEGFVIWSKWLADAWSHDEAHRAWQEFASQQFGLSDLLHWLNQAVPFWRQDLAAEDLQRLDEAAHAATGLSLYEICGIATPQEQAAGESAIKKRAPELPPEQPQAAATAQSTTEAPRPEAPSPRTTLIVPSTTFIANFQPPDYLVDGWLQRRFIYSFTGLTGTGKTAIALRLTAHVAHGLRLVTRDVEQGKVLYLAGENPDDVRMRWIKLCEDMQLDAGTPAVFWREGTMLLGNSNLWRLLIEDCRATGPFALVVIDTAAAYFVGNDENDNVQAGSYARLLRSFTKEIAGGPCVLVTTHPTKNAAPENLLPRGGGAFLNEMDGNLTCVKHEQTAEVHWLAKFRGPEFAPIPFLLMPGTSERLKDSKGRKVWTVTANPLGQAEHAVHEAANTRNENRVLKLLVTQPGLSLADMARALGWSYSNGDPNKSQVNRTLQALIQNGLAKKVGDHWEPTKAGKEKARNLPQDHETVEAPF